MTKRIVEGNIRANSIVLFFGFSETPASSERVVSAAPTLHDCLDNISCRLPDALQSLGPHNYNIYLASLPRFFPISENK